MVHLQSSTLKIIRVNYRRYLSEFFLILVIIIFIVTCGCIGIPTISKNSTQDISAYPPADSLPKAQMDSGAMDYPPLEPILVATPTQIQSNVSDWNPYNILPTPLPTLIRPSVLRNDTLKDQIILNATFTGSVGLAGYAWGKDLNITNGPFSITYSVHPNVTSPLLVWVKFTVYDPWQNVIAEEGYNRGYTSEGTKTMIIYREGRYYLTIEGEFASVDYTIKTKDPVPIVTMASVPEEVRVDEEEERG